MMQCKQAQELFSDQLAGQLDPALNVTLENHLRSCDACRAEFAGLGRVWASLDALPSVEPPPFFHENLMHKIHAAVDPKPQAGWNWRTLFQLRSPVFAAGVLLAVALFGMGELHAQRASLDPVGAIIRFLSPKPTQALPTLQTARAEWHPNGQGGGTLTLYLRAAAGTNLTVDSVNYRTAHNQHTTKVTDCSVTGDHETTTPIVLTSRPTSDLTLTLNGVGGSATVPVTLMEPLSDPAADH